MKKMGYWNAWALRSSRKAISRPIDKKEEEKCVCGHPRFMHASRNVFGKDNLGHCKVHSCRHSEGCRKFEKKKVFK